MTTFDELYEVMSIIKKENNADYNPPIPLFSFEGLPGAGKTTQIKRVAEALQEKYGKAFYIDLPTQSPIGKMMRMLYSDLDKWKIIRREMPWLNVVAISADLRLTMAEAVKKGAQYAIMSRGILSTYYYNLDAYSKEDDVAWEKMKCDMKAFYYPTAILFLDIDEETAHDRVVHRNRGPLREMDHVEKMKEDKKRIMEYLTKLDSVPVFHVNGNGSEEQVTEEIARCIEGILQGK